MKVICYGDSNTWGYDPRSWLGDRYDAGSRWVDILAGKTGWEICNRSLNGRSIPREAVTFPADADLLVVMLGTNDLLEGAAPETAARRMEQFLAGVNLTRERLLLIAPPPLEPGAWVQEESLPAASARLARLYRELAAAMGIRFADAGAWGVTLAYDGVHFTPEGHRAFAAGLYKEVFR